jgi:hypothetical protein
MAGGLPADLVEETALTLGSVGRISLPPEQWPAVQLILTAADHAVDADDAGALRAALDELHRVGLASQYFDDSPTGALPVIVDPTPPPPLAGAAPPRSYASPTFPGSGPVDFGQMSPPPPMAGAPPPMAGAPPRRATHARFWIGAGVLGVALLAIALLKLVSTDTHHAASPRPPATSATITALPSVTGAPPPTQTSATTSTTDTPTGKGGAAGIIVAGGLIATAALVIAVVVVLVRRRPRRSHAPPVHLVGAAEPPRRRERTAFTFAPNELVELANRTVDRLVAKGGGP